MSQTLKACCTSTHLSQAQVYLDTTSMLKGLSTLNDVVQNACGTTAPAPPNVPNTLLKQVGTAPTVRYKGPQWLQGCGADESYKTQSSEASLLSCGQWESSEEAFQSNIYYYHSYFYLI